MVRRLTFRTFQIGREYEIVIGPACILVNRAFVRALRSKLISLQSFLCLPLISSDVKNGQLSKKCFGCTLNKIAFGFGPRSSVEAKTVHINSFIGWSLNLLHSIKGCHRCVVHDIIQCPLLCLVLTGNFLFHCSQTTMG